MTAALTISTLAEHMRDIAARALDPSQRCHAETDAVLYGKVIMLSTIAEPHFGSLDLTREEDRMLMAAERELDRAYNHLRETVCPD